ncbi:2OG-Fe(II) oxygenase [Halobacteriovorax sp. HLS]|uniref:2OG-Fe(II) oxygenase n=1 Tax=Halobacteriovorax sp. HLS TaxID=2234000 RepID=UPI000FDB92C1|nr:2OG-Fe(II) oxygenase [Halobacteriovorax sp. HLS]
MYIRFVEDFLTKDQCNQLISKYNLDKHLSDIDTRKVQDRDKTIRELYLKRDDLSQDWSNDLESLDLKISTEIENYLEPLFNYREDYNFSHGVFWEQRVGEFSPEHFDAPFVYDGANDIHQRDFLVLLYLNENESGGEIIFPLQKQVFKPTTGSLIIFPTNQLFPHKTTPPLDQTRYLMRFSYFLNVEKIASAQGYVTSKTKSSQLS